MERWLDGFDGMPRRVVRCHLRTNPQPIEIWLRDCARFCNPISNPTSWYWAVQDGTPRHSDQRKSVPAMS
jgi:hypothetical protein